MCFMLDQFLWGHSSHYCDISCSTANLFFNTNFKAARAAVTGFKLSMYHCALPSSRRHRRSYYCSGFTLHRLTYLSNSSRKSVRLSVQSPLNFSRRDIDKPETIVVSSLSCLEQWEMPGRLLSQHILPRPLSEDCISSSILF